MLTIGTSFTGGSGTTFDGQITDSDSAGPSTIETSNNPAPNGSLGLKIVAPTTGYALLLTGINNNYTGKTTIGDVSGNAAVLGAGAANAFSPNSTVDVQAGGTFDLNGFNQTIAALDGDGAGTVTNSGRGLPATLTIGNAALPNAALSSSANLTDGASGGALALTKTASYTQVLAGTNTYSGPTQIIQGTLAAGAGTGFSSNSDFIVGTGAPGARLDVNGFNTSIGSLAGNGTVTNFGPRVAILTVGSNDTTFTGGIADGASKIGLTKTGARQLGLAGTNTYTGATTVSAGTLLVSGSVAGTANVSVGGGGSQATLSVAATGTVGSATLPVTIGTNGTLSGTGIVTGAVTATAGVIAPAPGTAAGLTIGGGPLVFQSASTFRLSLDNTRGASQPLASDYSKLTLGPAVAATLGGTLVTIDTNQVNRSDLYTIIVGGSGSTISGVFANANVPVASTISTYYYGPGYINYHFDLAAWNTAGTHNLATFESAPVSDSNSVALYLVPEPNALGLLAAGLGMVLGLRLQRRRK